VVGKGSTFSFLLQKKKGKATGMDEEEKQFAE
jgi:hypothetical protein